MSSNFASGSGLFVPSNPITLTNQPHSPSHIRSLSPIDLASEKLLRPPSPNFYQHYPRQYIASKIPSPLTIDGNIFKPEWQSAPWSEPFLDITGPSPDDNGPPSNCPTKIKMLYDDQYLYIAALVQYEKSENFSGEVIATFTERNSPIFQRDSDFEIFVDVTGTNHEYKEWEGNAWNTVWNLLLDKPYEDGGREFSGRVTTPTNNPEDPMYWDVKKQRTAVRVLEGEVNKPLDENERVLVAYEVALAFEDLAYGYEDLNAKFPPQVGDLWRINFSRVERQGKYNWVWSPQIVWDARERKFVGKVNMHLPDAWGYVQFGNEIGTETVKKMDPLFPARLVAMNVYYAQKAYLEKFGCYALTLDELKELVNQEPYFWEPFDVVITKRKVKETDPKPQGFYVDVISKRDSTQSMRLRDDRLLIVAPASKQTDI